MKKRKRYYFVKIVQIVCARMKQGAVSYHGWALVYVKKLCKTLLYRSIKLPRYLRTLLVTLLQCNLQLVY